jgi:invasion protein IalB
MAVVERMNRRFALALALAAVIWCDWSSDATLAQVVETQPADVVYSDWGGSCSVSKIADVVCVISREARSPAGKRLGLIVLGEQENSRFLFIDVERSQTASGPPLVAQLDGRPLRNGDVVCRDGDAFCSTTMAVNGKLLKSLSSGRELAVVDLSNRNVVLRFPLGGLP